MIAPEPPPCPPILACQNSGWPKNAPMPEHSARIVQPLWLLMRTSSLQGWRRLKNIHSTSTPLALTIGLFVVAYLSVSFVLFHRGLLFLNNFPALGSLLIE